MKKNLFNIIIILIGILLPHNVYAISTTAAKELIDVTKKVDLTINYAYSDYIFDNTEVKLYYIASITEDFQYQLSSEFLEYNIDINGTKTLAELNYINKTLNSFIDNNNIVPTINETIKSNKVLLSNLKQGLYLINTNSINTNKSTIIFENTLINIPNLQENGKWDYDVEIIPKFEEQFKEEFSPDTGDNISIYFYFLAFSFISLIILIISLIIKKITNKLES